MLQSSSICVISSTSQHLRNRDSERLKHEFKRVIISMDIREFSKLVKKSQSYGAPRKGHHQGSLKVDPKNNKDILDLNNTHKVQFPRVTLGRLRLGVSVLGKGRYMLQMLEALTHGKPSVTRRVFAMNGVEAFGYKILILGERITLVSYDFVMGTIQLSFNTYRYSLITSSTCSNYPIVVNGHNARKTLIFPNLEDTRFIIVNQTKVALKEKSQGYMVLSFLEVKDFLEVFRKEMPNLPPPTKGGVLHKPSTRSKTNVYSTIQDKTNQVEETSKIIVGEEDN
ncbi:hypothetical protein CR513_54265, partial [Mucuna pruriens]